MNVAEKKSLIAPRILLFDLDGTLMDPRSGIVACLRFALHQLRVSCPSDDELAKYIGPPLRGSFGKLLATTDAEHIESAMTFYRQRFAATGLFENQVYEGIPAMLELASQFVDAVYVATSKPAVYAERIVNHFGLDRHFRKVYGAELNGRWDDKAELLAHLLATEALAPDVAVMIGDRAVDIVAAKANGLRSIGVLWGYGTEDELVNAGADILCQEPAGLLGVLNRLALLESNTDE